MYYIFVALFFNVALSSDIDPSCMRLLNYTQGTFSSFDLPLNQTNTRCEWKIRVTDGPVAVRLEIVSINLISEQDCVFVTRNRREPESYCGPLNDAFIVTSYNNTMNVAIEVADFTSNWLNATYEEIPFYRENICYRNGLITETLSSSSKIRISLFENNGLTGSSTMCGCRIGPNTSNSHITFNLKYSTLYQPQCNTIVHDGIEHGISMRRTMQTDCPPNTNVCQNTISTVFKEIPESKTVESNNFTEIQQLLPLNVSFSTTYLADAVKSEDICPYACTCSNDKGQSNATGFEIAMHFGPIARWIGLVELEISDISLLREGVEEGATSALILSCGQEIQPTTTISYPRNSPKPTQASVDETDALAIGLGTGLGGLILGAVVALLLALYITKHKRSNATALEHIESISARDSEFHNGGPMESRYSTKQTSRTSGNNSATVANAVKTPDSVTVEKQGKVKQTRTAAKPAPTGYEYIDLETVALSHADVNCKKSEPKDSIPASANVIFKAARHDVIDTANESHKSRKAGPTVPPRNKAGAEDQSPYSDSKHIQDAEAEYRNVNDDATPQLQEEISTAAEEKGIGTETSEFDDSQNSKAGDCNTEQIYLDFIDEKTAEVEIQAVETEEVYFEDNDCYASDN